MGLAWQQESLGLHPAGRFLVAQPLPEALLYAEPARRRMRVELAGATVAQSDGVTLLHETGRYPVAYFPPAEVDRALLRASAKNTAHPLLGRVRWWSIEIGDKSFADVAWSHPRPPEHAAVMTDLLAFSWSEMDAFYEEDEPIFGHAPDPYHRVDVRASGRRLTVFLGRALVADTSAPLAVFESGFAPRWYVPRRDVVPSVLASDPRRTLCPYKGIAQYFDVVAGGERAAAAAWTYPDALPESSRISGYVSFDPALVDVSLDGQPLLPAAHQEIDSAGSDRDLDVDTRELSLVSQTASRARYSRHAHT